MEVEYPPATSRIIKGACQRTRFHLSMTGGWNHPLWSQICLLLSCISCFFFLFCIRPSLLCQGNHQGGHHYFTVGKREDHNICLLHPLSPSTSFLFFSNFPRFSPLRFGKCFSTCVFAYSCNYTDLDFHDELEIVPSFQHWF